MDNVGNLDLAWCQGYNGGEAQYIDGDVLCYQCGRNIKIIAEDGVETVFAFKGQGVGPIAVHKLNKHIAIAEYCINPKIYIYTYPTFREHMVLQDGAKLEYQKLTFSNSEYLAAISGLPDFELILWNYEKGIKLATVHIGSEVPTSLGFDPCNWRQLCLTTVDSITIWQTEQCNDQYVILPHKVRVPVADPSQEIDDEKDQDRSPTRASTRMSRYTVDVPKAAIAGLIGDNTEYLQTIQDKLERCSPVSQAWTPTGDVFIGCQGGQLLKVNDEVFKARVMYYPPKRPETAHTRASSAVEPGSRKTTLTDIQPIAEEDDNLLLQGCLTTLGLHRKGLYAAGEDGVLRLIDIKGNEFRILEHCVIGEPVTSMSFNPSYKNIVLGSSQGSLFLYTPDESTCANRLKSSHFGQFVGIGCLATPSDILISVREDGEIQAWSYDRGMLLSTLSLETTTVSLSCSPMTHLVAVGTQTGFVYFIDYTNFQSPRIVDRIRMARVPITHLQFSSDGDYLLVAGNDQHVYIIDGRPSTRFDVLGYTEFEGDIIEFEGDIIEFEGDIIEFEGDIIAMTCINSNKDVKVVVTTSTHTDKRSGANKLIYFTIPADITTDIKDKHESLKGRFKDEAIKKMNLHLTIPSYGASIGENNTLYTISQNSKKIISMALPDVKPKKLTSPESYLVPASDVPGHQLPGGHLVLSPHGKWLASYSTDGNVIFRSIGTMDKTVYITPHEYNYNGVREICFSEDGQKLFTVGFDGVLTASFWNFTSTGMTKAKSAIENARSRKMRLMGPQQQEDAAMAAMTGWVHPASASRTNSTLDREEREKIEQEKQAALENEEIFTTPVPTKRIDNTWLEDNQILAILEEDKQYADKKHNLRCQIRDIRKSIQQMMLLNESQPDIEKLNRHEFDLDIDEQTRLQALGEAEVQRVREEIEFENLAKMYLREMIYKECWEDMKVKGRSIQAYNSSLEVANFPLKDRRKESLELLETVQTRRQMEISAAEATKAVLEPTLKSTSTADEEVLEGEELEENNTEQPSTTGSLGALYGGGSDLFYSQFDLHSREQKISQIVLLEDALYRIKVTFNKEFDEVYQKKEQEIQKIKDKNKRIKKIIEDLDLKETVVEPELGVLEKPELLLTVKDSEVTVEKFLTPEQKKQAEAKQKAEEERKLREKGDNIRERALDMMMGGVLEIKKEDELKKDVPKPLFMTTKESEEWTEEEVKSAKEYEKKVQDLKEEREKYRKQLETELRKLEQVIADNMTGFDEVLNQLFMKKVKVMMVLYQEDLKINRLRYNLLLEEELEIQEHELNAKLEHKRVLKQLTTEAVNESKKNLEKFRDDYDRLLAEDKLMDKTFRREFNDVSAVMADTLFKLFKKRPRGQKFKGADTPVLDPSAPNPFAERPSTARQNAQSKIAMEQAIEELDRQSNMPENLEVQIWERLCHYRREKIESEQLVKTKALVLAEMNAFLQKRQEEEDSLRNETEDIMTQINRLREDRQRFTINLEVQLLLKQGQVEVDAGRFVHDFKPSALLHRSVVEDLNKTIKQYGEKKIASMMDSKDFRKGIIQLEWEHKRMLMEMDDLQNKMKDIQFMKVTREIQAYLSEKDYVSKKTQDILILEQTLQLLKKTHEKNVSEKRKILKDLNKTIRTKESSNQDLDSQLTEINVSVNERKHIDDVNAERRLDTGAEKRYKEIVQRRKLVDLAKAQAQEVAVLRAEVERLRMRTFPALVQAWDSHKAKDCIRVPNVHLRERKRKELREEWVLL
ncbi:hypothetical protein LOTGIDRAFT_233795 [Lottia gigantea]|uniref:Cilia- and flagella-associated protein 43 n=1 Tax=Lottia gigantea TaxID=225164 RepID=V4BMQ1_LOTGI|nr:hypothetical protein LOTGIDRAFT_233795 [Lottia gigantea]ESO90244.1 hypothetical protein LOTGIDRAFT_233795 [Lottia gigantea]